MEGLPIFMSREVDMKKIKWVILAVLIIVIIIVLIGQTFLLSQNQPTDEFSFWKFMLEILKDPVGFTNKMGKLKMGWPGG